MENELAAEMSAHPGTTTHFRVALAVRAFDMIALYFTSHLQSDMIALCFTYYWQKVNKFRNSLTVF